MRPGRRLPRRRRAASRRGSRVAYLESEGRAGPRGPRGPRGRWADDLSLHPLPLPPDCPMLRNPSPPIAGHGRAELEASVARAVKTGDLDKGGRGNTGFRTRI